MEFFSRLFEFLMIIIGIKKERGNIVKMTKKRRNTKSFSEKFEKFLKFFDNHRDQERK